VATEIRRLADNTMNSTMEIRNKIVLIEKAAKGLITASEHATKFIESGWENTTTMQTVFQAIKVSSEDTLSAVQAINESIRMQTQGFEQILLTMKQISEGANNFADSTTMTSKTAQDLSGTVTVLWSLFGSNEDFGDKKKKTFYKKQPAKEDYR